MGPVGNLSWPKGYGFLSNLLLSFTIETKMCLQAALSPSVLDALQTSSSLSEIYIL